MITRKPPKPCNHSDWRFNSVDYAPKGSKSITANFRCGECGALGVGKFAISSITWTGPIRFRATP